MACLALAMTGTSALLGWMAPSSPGAAGAAPDGRHLAEIAGLARSAVVDDIVVPPGRWREIDVAAGTNIETGGRLLAATADFPPWHFFVNRDGRPVRALSWREQRAPADSPHTVRIQVAPAREGNISALIQRLSVQALIAALNEALSADQTPLPVTLPHAWSRL